MNYKAILFLNFFICNVSYGQISVNRNLNLELAEKDSLKSLNIENSLNAFLTEAQNGTYTNNYVDTAHIKKHQFFFNKLSGIGKDSDAHNNPLVLKSYPIKNGNYRLTVAFTGQNNGQPFVYQVTELIASPYNNHYRFYCPFEENTINFNTKKFDNVTYHFSGSINENKANEFVRFINNISKLTNVHKSNLNYYSFKDLDELLKSYGFLYSARQCNFLCYDLGFTDNEGQVYITGTNNENYVFGYMSDYLYYNLPNNEDIYWPFVQGVSTYYGGYALSYDDMDELKKQFRNALMENPDINFLYEFKKGRKSSVNRHFSYYVMSAFLYEDALNTKGFDEAISLVYSGNKGEDFFEILEKVLNVNEDEFHNKILSLISES